MPKVNRTLAQRYAAASRKRKSEKRRPLPPPPQPTESALPSVEAGFAATSPGMATMSAQATSPAPAAGTAPVRPAVPRSPSRATPPPRRATLPSDYRYVFYDMRRVVLVAGGLLAALIAASFVIR